MAWDNRPPVPSLALPGIFIYNMNSKAFQDFLSKWTFMEEKVAKRMLVLLCLMQKNKMAYHNKRILLNQSGLYVLSVSGNKSSN